MGGKSLRRWRAGGREYLRVVKALDGRDTYDLADPDDPLIGVPDGDRPV